MSTNLVIVESPAKAKTIEKYLGKKFTVSSCYGHIRDLPKDDKSIDKENGFLPSYVPSPDKKKVINELKKLKNKSDKVYLATDNDREGEAIAWHLKEILNLEEKDYDRIIFREITKNAILNSLENPTKINMDLVNAQQARRILDRLVGFEISPILWKKIKPKLSAGRVQSVAVKFVVERENEINAFVPNKSLKTTGVFVTNEKNEFNADLKERFESIEEAENFLKDCSKSDFTINKINKKPSKRSPSAPFTTSTLQQEASRRIGFSPSMTMSTAQKLYESGHITYMRTDSVNLSKEAITSAKSIINTKFGQNYSKTRIYKTKNNNAQEAHEAIRPTNFNIEEIGKNENEKRLYNLIWRRTLASQMSDSIFERTVAKISISNSNLNFKTEGEVQIFDGFLKLYNRSSPEDEKKLPKLKENSSINFKYIISKEVPIESKLALLFEVINNIGYHSSLNSLINEIVNNDITRLSLNDKYTLFGIFYQIKDTNATIKFGKSLLINHYKGDLSDINTQKYIADILFEVMDINNFIDFCNQTFKTDKIEGMLYTLINAYQHKGDFNVAIQELDRWLLDNPLNQRMKNKKQKVIENQSIQ